MLSNLSVRLKIFLGFGAVLVTTAFLAIFSIVASEGLGRLFADYKVTAEELKEIKSAEAAVQQARKAAFQYRINPDPAARAEAETALAAMLEQAEPLGGSLLTERYGSEIARLSDQSSAYAAAFAEFAAATEAADAGLHGAFEHGLDARRAITGVIDQAQTAGDAEALVHAARAQQALILARLYLERFQRSGAQEDADRIRSETAGARESLALLAAAATPAIVATAAPVDLALAAFGESADVAIEAMVRAEAIASGRLDVLGPQITDGYSAIRTGEMSRLEGLGQTGEAEILRSEAWVFAISVAAMILGLALAFALGRAILRPLDLLKEAVEGLAKGQPVVVPLEGRTDEFGAVAAGVGAVSERGLAATRVQEALNSSAALLMIADNDHNIVFMNDGLRKLLAESEAEIRRALPNFRASTIVGSNIDVFHKNPQHQRGMVDALTGTHSAQLEVGALMFHLNVNPVMSPGGERIGTVVDWREISSEARLQREIDMAVDAAAHGDFSRRIAAQAGDGQLGEIAEKINDVMQSVDRGVTEVERVMSQVADGNLNEEMAGEFEGKFASLKTSVNGSVGQLRDLVGKIQSMSIEMAQSVEQISSGATDLSERAESQASSLQETAATMEEMTATIKTNSDNAKVASTMAQDANERADQGGQVVSETVVAMDNIEDSAKRISDILAVIDGIAFQTNLLALNAAVEAARAGDAGKGFAVVASEVRTLAQRSGDAAKDIRALIDESSSHVAEGVRLVGVTGGSLTSINEAIAKVRGTVAEIENASSEQATGVEEITAAVTNLDSITQQNAALATETSAAAQSLTRQASELAKLVRLFDTGRQIGAASSAGAAPAPAAGAEAAADDAWVNAERETTAAAPAPAPMRAPAAASGDDWAEF